jgi:hypothetical protein
MISGNAGRVWSLLACFGLILAGATTASHAAGEGEKLKRRQATIKGLVIRQLGNGKMTGMAIGVVATASGATKGGEIRIRGEIGEQMTSALKEAERYVRVEHPQLGNSRIELSFEERYTPKDGGSAGTAFAVLIRSLAEGYEIDPGVAITGDIAVNGTVQPIGGVTAKLRGCRADGCSVAIIPKANVPAVADLLITADKVDVLADLQVFSVETVDSAAAIARVDREPKIALAMKDYREVQAALKARRIAALREPGVQAKLRNVLELAPHHISAKYALDIAQNKGPTTLTRTASVIEIFSAVEPFRQAVSENKTVKREHLPAATVKQMQKELTAIRRTMHPDVEGVRKSLVDWIDAVDRVLSATKPISPADMQVINRRRQALLDNLKKLGSDEALVAKMMREGY